MHGERVSRSRLPPPLVSVVVPAYNHAGLVEESLRSVARQTHGPLELVVVDDASSDGTAEVVEGLFADPAFAARFRGRLVFERQPINRGAHAALNRGMALARGEWIAPLNSDDRYDDDRLAIMLAALEARRASLAFSAVRFIDASGHDVTGTDQLANSLARSQGAISNFASVGFALLRENVTISTGNLLFSRELLSRVGGFRDLRYCHDWDFALRCLLEVEPIFVDAPLYHYRLHATNSFRSLADVADTEAQECLRTYFAAVRRSAFENWLAPGPTTWPRLFDRFIVEHGLERSWRRAARART
jgi:glycosyltransferase involved in cell wall biosynthesis